MKYIDFLFTFDWGHLFYNELTKRDFKVCLITETTEQDLISVSNNWNYKNINEIRNRFLINKSLSIDNELKRLSVKYNFIQYRRAIFNTFYYSNWFTEKDLMRELCLHLLSWEYLFEEEINCKYFLRFSGEFVDMYAAKIIAMKYSKVICFANNIMFNRIQFVDDFLGRWLIKPYEVLPTNEERMYLKNFIKNSINNKVIISSGAGIFTARIKLRYILGFIKKLKHLIRKPLGYSYTNNPFWLTRDIFFRLLRKMFYKIIYTHKLPDEPFIYFPLHVSYDSALTAIAEPFVYQMNLIELIHRYLPFGYKLIIKEHPQQEGVIPINQIKQIFGLKDVIILPPYFNSHDIIRKARLITVICSSVGLEAILYKKPVMTFADTYYTGQGVSIDIRNFLELSSNIVKALDFKPEEEEIIKMLTRVFRDTFPVDAKKLYHQDISIIEPFVDSLLQYCSING